MSEQPPLPAQSSEPDFSQGDVIQGELVENVIVLPPLPEDAQASSEHEFSTPPNEQPGDMPEPIVRTSRRVSVPTSEPGQLNEGDFERSSHDVILRPKSASTEPTDLPFYTGRRVSGEVGVDYVDNHAQIRRVARVVTKSEVTEPILPRAEHRAPRNDRQPSAPQHRQSRQTTRPETLPQSEWGRKKIEEVPDDPNERVRGLMEKAESGGNRYGAEWLTEGDRKFIKKLATEYNFGAPGSFELDGKKLDSGAVLFAQKLVQKLAILETYGPKSANVATQQANSRESAQAEKHDNSRRADTPSRQSSKSRNFLRRLGDKIMNDKQSRQ